MHILKLGFKSQSCLHVSSMKPTKVMESKKEYSTFVIDYYQNLQNTNVFIFQTKSYSKRFNT